MTDPGAYRHRISFQTYTGEADEFGDPVLMDDDNWTETAKVWASVNPISGRELFAAEQSQSEVTHRVRCRYRSGVTPLMRIVFHDRVFRILSVIDFEERHETLQIMCREVLM